MDPPLNDSLKSFKGHSNYTSFNTSSNKMDTLEMLQLTTTDKPETPAMDRELSTASSKPDGSGRCYQLVIVCVVFLINFLVVFPYMTMSVLYLDFVTHFGVSVTTVGFLPSIYDMGVNLSGKQGQILVHQ